MLQENAGQGVSPGLSGVASLGVGSGVTIEVPELRKESLKTTVVMPDGGTLLLGGLKFFEEQDYQSGVPILQDIPIVSLLFSRKGKYTNMRDLIVLLKVDVLIMEEYEPTLIGLPGQEAWPEPAELSPQASRLRLFSYLFERRMSVHND